MEKIDLKIALVKAAKKLRLLHPDKTEKQIAQVLTTEYYKRTGQCTPINSAELVHFRPLPDTNNVRCLNGSAHAISTSEFNDVTCPKCLDIYHAWRFWSEKRAIYWARIRRQNELKLGL